MRGGQGGDGAHQRPPPGRRDPYRHFLHRASPLGKEQAASELAEVLDRYPFGGMEGHGEACYYCGEECNSLAGNPGRWPIPLTHPDEPGVVKWHHIRCVSERLSDDKISR